MDTSINITSEAISVKLLGEWAAREACREETPGEKRPRRPFQACGVDVTFFSLRVMPTDFWDRCVTPNAVLERDCLCTDNLSLKRERDGGREREIKAGLKAATDDGYGKVRICMVI